MSKNAEKGLRWQRQIPFFCSTNSLKDVQPRIAFLWLPHKQSYCTADGVSSFENRPVFIYPTELWWQKLMPQKVKAWG